MIGHSQKYVERMFTACLVAGHNGNSPGVRNQEDVDHLEIFTCGGPPLSWPEFWREYRAFG